MTVGVAPVGATEPIELEDGDDFIYHGQTVLIDVADEFDVEDGDEMYVYELEDDSIEAVADRPTVEDGTITFDSDDIDDSDGPQFALTAESGLDGTVREYTIDEQRFDVEWDRETVTSSDAAAELEVDTNRPSEYNVTISADDLDYDDLAATFLHNDTDVEEVTEPAQLPFDRLDYDPDDGDDLEDLRDDGYLTLNLAESDNYSADGAIDANFMALDETEGLPDDGDYNFDLTVTDTTAEDSSSIEIGETGAAFDEDHYTHAAGDLVELTVDLEATDDAWLMLGGEDAGFVDVLYVEDDDGSGDVTFTANTRLMGTDHSHIDGVGPDDTDIVYDAEDDVIESYIHDEIVGTDDTDVGEATFYADANVEDGDPIPFEEYLAELDILDAGDGGTDQLDRPLQPTVYGLTVERGQNFVVDDGEAAADDAIGSAELDLFQPSVGDANTSVAPAADADDTTTVDALESETTASDGVAIGDRAVVEFEATGLTGALATIDYVENGNDIVDGPAAGYRSNVLYELTDGDSTWSGEGITFEFEGPNIPNQEPNTLALEDAELEDIAVLASIQERADESGTLAIVVDTDDEPFAESLEDGDDFDARLAYEGGAERYEFDRQSGVFGGEDGDTSVPSHPYTPTGTTYNATATPTFESPAAAFDNADGGTVPIPPEPNAPATGETNVAPGTTVTVTVRDRSTDDESADEEPPFLVRDEPTVTENGTFDAQLALEDRSVAEQGIVEFDYRGETIETTDVIFAMTDDDRPPYFETNLEAPETVDPGDAFEVNATVQNTGDEPGTAALRTTAGEEVLIDEALELEANATNESTATIDIGNETDTLAVVASTQDTAAMSTVAIDETDPTPTVDEPVTEEDDRQIGGSTGTNDSDTSDDDEPSPADEEADGVPGFGILVGVVTVVLGVIVASRCWD
ncbi:hypothetical protein D8Y22_14255 [Salinadaptatus halalkaliphilus]|uniref:DUF7827 domain-containing protein n=1 Tax=Salinadaptatus halalkaliphilus TaxID=2419781 RepID=A0A4S3TKX3_9EURY|nr:BGTF surface domain-containing protein [Salinadaptatus halalkaliphilus]THE64220.1 hypothetical protein D8Y22_14255 [Salinadaptatus halalkaliphilus]